MNYQLSSTPSAANIFDDPQGPVWTHGSPRRHSNLEVERLWFGVTSNKEVPGRSVRWMVTLIVPNINRFLPPSTFPTTRGVRFVNWMELLSIPQVPLWSFSGGRRSRSFRDGQHSLQIWILLSISGEELRRTKPKNLEELWDACKVAFHAIPDDFINKLYDSLPNRMATVLQAKGTHARY